MGSAVATLAAYGTMMLLSYFLGRKYYPVPYDIKKIIGYLLLAILFSGIVFYVFDRNLYLGTVLLLVFLLLVILSEKKELKRIMKR